MFEQVEETLATDLSSGYNTKSLTEEHGSRIGSYDFFSLFGLWFQQRGVNWVGRLFNDGKGLRSRYLLTKCSDFFVIFGQKRSNDEIVSYLLSQCNPAGKNLKLSKKGDVFFGYSDINIFMLCESVQEKPSWPSHGVRKGTMRLPLQRKKNLISSISETEARELDAGIGVSPQE